MTLINNIAELTQIILEEKGDIYYCYEGENIYMNDKEILHMTYGAILSLLAAQRIYYKPKQ